MTTPEKNRGGESLKELAKLLQETEKNEKISARVLRLAANLKTEIRNCLSNDHSETNIVGSIEQFLSQEITNSDTSKQVYITAFRRFHAWCKKVQKQLNDLEYSDLAAYSEDLQREYKPGTVRVHFAAIRSACDWLMRNGYLPGNPVPIIRTAYKEYPTSEQLPLLKLDEVQKIFGCYSGEITDIRDRAVIGLMVYTFVPVSSIPELKNKDFFEKEGATYVRLQIDKESYEVPLHPNAVDYMADYLNMPDKRNQPSDPEAPLFPGRTGMKVAKGMSRISVYNLVKKASKKAQLEKEISPIQLRMTGVAAFLQSQPDSQEVSSLMGYRNATTFARHIAKTEFSSELGSLFLDTNIEEPLQEFIRKSCILET
ncbi:MAG TPA: tyrosine-type recombinase/integrase [Candidatus Peribacteraceae bacterium]|nr:MAG: hypothetical protein A3J67_03625 [Parcubacteria group bacterium RIFCSPHIGHO2_02_FULL_48_10b]HLD64142.1 tyrosine-type recombinase/integrase [Candidatus Peribacteraceae bacterium]